MRCRHILTMRLEFFQLVQHDELRKMNNYKMPEQPCDRMAVFFSEKEP